MKQEEYRKTIEKAFPLRKELKQDMSRELFRTQNKKRGKEKVCYFGGCGGSGSSGNIVYDESAAAGR